MNMDPIATPAQAQATDPRYAKFGYSNFTIRRKILQILGRDFHIYNPQGELVLFAKLKAFKLKEDIKLYADESMTQPLMSIMARSILDFGATYDVVDLLSGQRLGAYRRKALKSILRDEWAILDTNDQEVGTIVEDSLLMALVRRFLTPIFPQSYTATVSGFTVAHYAQNWNPFVGKIDVSFFQDRGVYIDPRLGLAAGVLLCAVEGKQQ